MKVEARETASPNIIKRFEVVAMTERGECKIIRRGFVTWTEAVKCAQSLRDELAAAEDRGEVTDYADYFAQMAGAEDRARDYCARGHRG